MFKWKPIVWKFYATFDKTKGWLRGFRPLLGHLGTSLRLYEILGIFRASFGRLCGSWSVFVRLYENLGCHLGIFVCLYENLSFFEASLGHLWSIFGASWFVTWGVFERLFVRVSLNHPDKIYSSKNTFKKENIELLLKIDMSARGSNNLGRSTIGDTLFGVYFFFYYIRRSKSQTDVTINDYIGLLFIPILLP